MDYYNKLLNGNIPLGIVESVKGEQHDFKLKQDYSHYQIKENNLFESDIDDVMNSNWAPVIKKSLQLNRDKILAGVNSILRKSLKSAIDNNKNEVSKIGQLSNNDSVQIKTIVNLVAKTFSEKFLELIKGLKINYNLSNLHIKLVHLAGLTGLNTTEIDNIAGKLGLELELSLGFKVNTSIDISQTLYEILTPKIIKACNNNLSSSYLFNELYVSKLSQIVLGIWESILENIMTLSKYNQISSIYAFSVEFADTLYIQSTTKDNIIETFLDAGNKTSLSDTTRIKDLKEINKNIDQSKVIAGMASFVSSAVNNAVSKNSADLLRSIAASNTLSLNGASGTSFTFSKISQTNIVSQETNANFVQVVTNKVINEIATSIKNKIDTSTKQLSTNVKKSSTDEKSGSSLGGILDSLTNLGGKALDSLANILQISAGNSVDKSSTKDITQELKDTFNLNQSFKLNKTDDVKNALSNILSTENLAKCDASTRTDNSINISKLTIDGPIIFSELDQTNRVNDVMKCAFNQSILNEIANKIINDYDNTIIQLLENVNNTLDETQKAQMQGDILSAGVAGSAVCEAVGKGIGDAATGVGTGIGDAATGVGTGVGSAATGVGTGVGAAATGVGTGVGTAAKGIGEGIGSVMSGLLTPLLIGGGIFVFIMICYIIYKYSKGKGDTNMQYSSSQYMQG